MPPSCWCLTPYYVSLLLFLSLPLVLILPSSWLDEPTIKHSVAESVPCSHYFQADSTDANYSNSDCDRQIVTFAQCVWCLAAWKTEAWSGAKWKGCASVSRFSVFFHNSTLIDPPQRETQKCGVNSCNTRPQARERGNSEIDCNRETQQDDRKLDNCHILHGQTVD